jgi:hypothetical protein
MRKLLIVSLHRLFADGSETISGYFFVEASGERFRKNRKN